MFSQSRQTLGPLGRAVSGDGSPRRSRFAIRRHVRGAVQNLERLPNLRSQAGVAARTHTVGLLGMPQTTDVSTPKLVLVLMRASRSLAEFLEAGLAREGIQTTDFTILEVLLHKRPLGDRGHRAEGAFGDGSAENGSRSSEAARDGQWAQRSKSSAGGMV